jgi:hypothetical protein
MTSVLLFSEIEVVFYTTRRRNLLLRYRRWSASCANASTYQRPGALYHARRSRLHFIFNFFLPASPFSTPPSFNKSHQPKQNAQTYPTLLAIKRNPSSHYSTAAPSAEETIPVSGYSVRRRSPWLRRWPPASCCSALCPFAIRIRPSSIEWPRPKYSSAAAPRNLGTVYKPLADSKGDEDHSSAMLILSWPNEDVVLIRLLGPGPANSGGIRRHWQFAGRAYRRLWYWDGTPRQFSQ